MSELPENWTTALIGDIIEFSPKNNVPDNTEAGFIPLHLMGKRFLDKHGFEKKRWSEIKKGYTHFADGDVLLARITPSFENGKGGLVEGLPNGIGAGSTEYFVCRPIKELLHPKYLLAFFKTTKFLNEGANVMQGAVGQQRVPKQYILEHEIPLPPLHEQKRIAKKLNSLLTQVDSCQTHLRRVPQILKHFRQSILAAVVTGRLSENNKKEDGQDLPKGWRWVKLTEITSQVKDADHKMPKPAVSDIPYISTKDFINHDDIDFENAKHISEEDYINLTRKIKPEFDDILLSRYGTIGEVRKVKTNRRFQASYSIAIIKPIHDLVLTDFLVAVLRSDVGQEQMRQNIRASSQPDLGLENIRKFNIPLPSIEEQAEIVRRAEKLFAYAERLEARYNSAFQHVERLTPSLLAKAFRGELVEQDPNDEPAEHILQRNKVIKENDKVKVKKIRPKRDVDIEYKKIEAMMPANKEIPLNYLSLLLKESGPSTAEALWAMSQLDIDEFYDQLKKEEENNLVREIRRDDDNAPRLLEAV